MIELLPDCRLKTPPIGRNMGIAGTWMPVFCANCGRDGGLVPENSTFLFYLCNDCAPTHGHIAGTMVMPDEVFYERLAEAQIEQYGHYLSPAEWGTVAEDPSHPLWTLLREQPR